MRCWLMKLLESLYIQLAPYGDVGDFEVEYDEVIRVRNRKFFAIDVVEVAYFTDGNPEYLKIDRRLYHGEEVSVPKREAKIVMFYRLPCSERLRTLTLWPPQEMPKVDFRLV